MMPPQVVVEAAVPADAEVLRHIQTETWYATYVSPERGVTYEGLKLFQEGENGERAERRIAFWRHQIATAGSTHAVFMARTGGQTVGYVAPSLMNGQWRVGALYVLPEAQGRHAGSGLMRAALGWLGAGRDVYCHVAEYNDRAIRFYRHFGFELTGVRFDDDGAPPGARIPELEMLRAGVSGRPAPPSR
jgi:ribosomal protein S18 acetylase RimI-like enzyme